MSTRPGGSPQSTQPEQPLLRVDTRPTSQEPPRSWTEPARNALPGILNNAPQSRGVPARSECRAVDYAVLRQCLEAAGHNRDAAEWAIHWHVEAGRLGVEPGFSCTPGVYGDGGWRVPPRQTRTTERERCVLWSTLELWEWWKANDFLATSKSERELPSHNNTVERGLGQRVQFETTMPNIPRLDAIELCTLRWLVHKLSEPVRIVLIEDVIQFLDSQQAKDQLARVFAILESLGTVRKWETPLPQILQGIMGQGQNPALVAGSKECAAFLSYQQRRQSGWEIDGKAVLLLREIEEAQSGHRSGFQTQGHTSPSHSTASHQQMELETAGPHAKGERVPSLSADDLPSYRRAIERVIHTWGSLANHIRVRLTAALRREHGTSLQDGFEGRPDIPRSFQEACIAFRQAIQSLHVFEKHPPDFPWLQWVNLSLTLDGPLPDIDHWIASLKGIGEDEWRPHIIDPFREQHNRASLYFEECLKRFEQAKEIVITSSANATVARLRIERTVSQVVTEEHQRREKDHADRRLRLHQLFTAALNGMGNLNETVDVWVKRVTAGLSDIGREIVAQAWEDWARENAEGEPVIGGLIDLMLRGDEANIDAVVRELWDSQHELRRLADWLRSMQHDWSFVFDHGWLWWKFTRDLPLPQPKPALPATTQQKKQTPAGQGEVQSASRGAQPTQCDLGVVTAMPDELNPLFRLTGGKESWKPFQIDRFVHYHKKLYLDGQALDVVAVSLWRYGDTPTSGAVHRLKQVHPQMLAMTGICAGWEGKDGIEFGDVVIAEGGFQPREGKQEGTKFHPDTHLHMSPAWVVQQAKDFLSDEGWVGTVKTKRPRSIRSQGEWLLCQMGAAGFKLNDPDWTKVRAEDIAYDEALAWLTRRNLVKDGGIAAAGHALLEKRKAEGNGECKPRRDRDRPKAHVGAFASDALVIAVEAPFEESASQVRSTRAYDLEVKTFLQAAAELGIPAVAVKGVSDYGTMEKDDHYRHYAAEAAACWLVAFVRQYSRFWTEGATK